MPAISASSAASFESRSGAKPPSSPTAVARPRSCSVLLSAWKTSTPVRSASEKRRRAHRHDHELLEVDLVVGVRAAVQHVHHRHRQHVRRLAAEVAPQRQAGLGRGRLGRRRATRRGSRWRRAAPCWACRRARSSRGRAPAWSAASSPRTASAISPFTFATAWRHALAAPAPRRRRAARPPRTRRSRRRTARRRGRRRRTSARTSTSTVGLPRLSRICRACTCSISLNSASTCL